MTNLNEPEVANGITYIKSQLDKAFKSWRVVEVYSQIVSGHNYQYKLEVDLG